MNVAAIKTHKITQKDTDIFSILDKYLPILQENSVVAVTSKIISICEGSMVKIDEKNPNQKDELIKEESAFFLPRGKNPYNVSLTITKNILAPSAGIDTSNANGYFILWPKNPQESANKIREHVVQKTGIKNLGVIITDSKTNPMRWGVTAIAIAYSGIEPLKNYINTPDIFGRLFIYEQMSIIDNLAGSAALVMGEGKEQTPLAIITEIPMVTFVQRNPTEEELKKMRVTLSTDMYGGFFKNAPWQKGRVKRDE